MAKPEWGKKRICQSCGTVFYDLRRSPPVCPRCETVFEPEQALRARRRGSAVEREAPAAAAPAVVDGLEEGLDAAAEIADDALADDIPEEIETEEEGIPEDTSDLGGDDDVAEVIENVETEREEG